MKERFKEYLKKYLLIYTVAISIPILVGILSALFTKGNMDIYKEIVKPPLAPPSLLFPIAWSILYVLMGISSAQIYSRTEEARERRNSAFKFYIISLAFNFGWSIIFFNIGEFFYAFLWLLVLLYFVIRTILEYRKIYPLAAYLQIPYALWVAFAGYLNVAIAILNR